MTIREVTSEPRRFFTSDWTVLSEEPSCSEVESLKTKEFNLSNADSSVAAHSIAKQSKISATDDSIELTFSDICVPGIVSQIARHLSASHPSTLYLNHQNRTLYYDEDTRVKALQFICMSVFARRIPENEFDTTLILIGIIQRIRNLSMKRRLEPIECLVENPHSNAPGIPEFIYDELNFIKESDSMNSMTNILRLQIKAASRAQNLQAELILNSLPENDDVEHLINIKKIEPYVIAHALIRSIPRIEADDRHHVLGASGWYIKHLNAMQKSDLFEEMISVIPLFTNLALAHAVNFAIHFLPHFIESDEGTKSKRIIECISELQQHILKIDRRHQGPFAQSLTSNFVFIKERSDIKKIFRNFITDAKLLPDYQLESTMAALYAELEKCGLINDHELCYQVARIIQVLDHPEARFVCLRFAHYLPRFNRSGIQTGRTVMDSILRRPNDEPREIFLREVNRYFEGRKRFGV